MSKKYLVHNPDQLLLMPVSLGEWLPASHLVYFIIDVVDQLDLRAITRGYADNLRGAPPFSPHLMLRILFYAYCMGVYSASSGGCGVSYPGGKQPARFPYHREVSQAPPSSDGRSVS